MCFKSRKTIVLGKVDRELLLSWRFGLLKWRWRRTFFRSMKIDVASMLNPHVMITGESGAGKSNVCKNILKQLAGIGANFVVLDPHSEYVEDARDMRASVYDAGTHSINVFDLDGLTERERTAEIAGMFRRIFHLGEVQAYTLHKCIAYTYGICFQKEATPNIRSLMYTIKVFKKHAGRPEANILESLEKRLLVVAGEGFARSVSVSSIMHGRSVFSLASLHSTEAQTVFMESMLRKIYTLMLGSERRYRGRFYIVVDEAEKLQDSPTVARLVAEGRKYGIGMIAISQRAKALDREIRSNSATVIAFAQHEPEEQNYVANLIAGGNEYNRFVEVKKALRELNRGYALVHEAGRRNPKIVKCLRFEVRERDPSHRIISLARDAASERELVYKLRKEGFDQESVTHSIAELLRKGTLKYHFVREAPYSGTWYIAMPRNSPEHDIMVNLISRHLNMLGIKNKIYNNAYGPDIIAYRDGEKIAVEYETGMKNPEETDRMVRSRSLGYKDTIVLRSGE